MKKYPSGFVPINFQQVGQLLLIIGVVCSLVRGYDIFFGMNIFDNTVLYFGLLCIVLGLYLKFVVPKEK